MMADIPERLRHVHHEALSARELTFQAAAGIVVVLAIVLSYLSLRDGFQPMDLALILLPTVFIGLMVTLARRIGLAYAIIRHLEGRNDS